MMDRNANSMNNDPNSVYRNSKKLARIRVSEPIGPAPQILQLRIMEQEQTRRRRRTVTDLILQRMQLRRLQPLKRQLRSI